MLPPAGPDVILAVGGVETALKLLKAASAGLALRSFRSRPALEQKVHDAILAALEPGGLVAVADALLYAEGPERDRMIEDLYAHMARHGISAAQLAAGQGEALLRDWAAELAIELPGDLPASCALRRSRARFDRARLQRLATGKGFAEPPALATLWRAWRAARRDPGRNYR